MENKHYLELLDVIREEIEDKIEKEIGYRISEINDETILSDESTRLLFLLYCIDKENRYEDMY